MKKSALVITLAVCLVLAFSASAFAVGPFFKITPVNGSANNVDSNSLSWGYAKTLGAADNVGSPHGNYLTTTNKCAVCHAVHRADSAGTVLTPIDLSALTYTKGCAFCHAAGGSGFSVKTAVMGTDGSISPHTTCDRCHVASPHGAGVSRFPVLGARLINQNADDQISWDENNSRNDLQTISPEFQDPSSKLGLTLATGYLCDNCHFHTAVTDQELVFPVYPIGGLPAVGDVDAGDVNDNWTGHRVYTAATTNWNQADEFNAYYTGGGAAGATSQIAFDGAQGCDTCHDAKDANGNTAFPHGYVDAVGAYATKGQAGGSLVWLTTGASAIDTRIVLGTPAGGTSSANEDAINNLLSEDGLCLKCHVAGNGTSGVGYSF